MFLFFFFLILAFALVLFGRLAIIAQVNNSPRANVFPAGEANFGQAMYWSLERSPQDTGNGFDLWSTQALAWPRVDLARLLRHMDFRPFWIISFEFVKVCGIRFSSKESFIGFYTWCYLNSTILACLFTAEFRGKSCGGKGAWRPRCHLVNLSKLSWNIVWSLRTTTTNCRVSFIDFYSVFPTNFRVVFLPHTNTVIFMKP